MLVVVLVVVCVVEVLDVLEVDDVVVELVDVVRLVDVLEGAGVVVVGLPPVTTLSVATTSGGCAEPQMAATRGLRMRLSLMCAT